MRVLIVDDNADMRSFARVVLQQAGMEAETAANGRRALDLQRDRPADVLITDMFMPEPDGIELIQRFKSEFPQVRVVAITGGAKLGGRGAKEALFVARQIGADAVLEKPFAGDALIRAVQDLKSV